MTEEAFKLAWPDPGCCDPSPDGCICPPMERALRGWMRQDSFLTPMTPEQREACLAEIDRVEGHSRTDHDGADDAQIARGVLDAWTDFCRDKGLL